WAKAIVDSFRIAGASAAGLGTTGLRPGDMFGTAVELAHTINQAETWNPLSAVAIAVSALVVLLCFAFISALMFVTLVESYIVIN
ncbi:type IV secretion system protein, partial [Escherichia coli]|uniref:type IV secretion system protein n=1 Tax=Escherichia coli TaxID=562 RepID=UPI0028DF0AA3